ncbi:hypothetical protein [Streptacidiphilus carbonis]|uniref:hypothetical protein n=1 Tax=Streptacidiphilus carbonis TaxID=105422 RepID=UPI0005AB153F|nr:hypothetical protein [Streptacidiphilus carbonis]
MTAPVLPGDFGLIPVSGVGGGALRVAEFLDEVAQGHWRSADRDSLYRHVFLVERVDADGTVHALEAWPGGARRNTYRLDDPRILWSSGHFALTPEQRQIIVAWGVDHLGDGYAWDVYLRQAAVRLHVPFAAAALKRQVEDRNEYICSQYQDCAYQAAKEHVFMDGRAPYDVAPNDLAEVLRAK